MPAIRIVPAGDAPFPYEAAKDLLTQDADLSPADLAPLIAAGRRMGWTEEMVQSHEEMAHRGLCFEFVMRGESALRGSLYEDNIFFSVTGDEKAAGRYIKELARKLGARVYKH